MPIKFEDFYLQQTPKLLNLSIRILIVSGDYRDIKQDAKDVVQHCWIRTLELHPELLENWDALAGYLYGAVEKKSMRLCEMKRKKANLSKNQNEKLLQTNDISEDLFLNDYLSSILSKIPEKFAFICQKIMQMEDMYQQNEIVMLIQEEYQKKFNKVLTLDNFRKMKERSMLMIKNLLKLDALYSLNLIFLLF